MESAKVTRLFPPMAAAAFAACAMQQYCRAMLGDAATRAGRGVFQTKAPHSVIPGAALICDIF
jgi:hypothetical protein